MSFLATLTRSFARSVDRANASQAPLDLDGARPRTHAAETKIAQLQELIVKPAVTPADLVSLSASA